MADNNTPTKIKSADEIKVKRKPSDIIFTIVFTIICAFWVYPLIMVLINSFKEKLSISRDPFNLPDEKSFVGLENFDRAVNSQMDFFSALVNSLIITVLSVALILLCTSMCAYFVIRVNTWYTKLFYYLCLFSLPDDHVPALEGHRYPPAQHALPDSDCLFRIRRGHGALHVHQLPEVGAAGN